MRPTASRCCRAAVTARVAVEAGTTGLWWRYVGTAGRIVGIDHYWRIRQGTGGDEEVWFHGR